MFAQKIVIIMDAKLIGREFEISKLNSYIKSNRSEFIAVYGRRRVGKTFLIREACADNFAFFATGMFNVSLTQQLANFGIAMQESFGTDQIVFEESWTMAFYQLSRYLELQGEGVKIIFLDELPWFSGAKSGFVPALENFWNSWAARRDDIKLIVCGSSTSWMLNNLIHNRGGLHGRITHTILLAPFTLKETEQYFKEYGFGFSRKQIAECYMVTGGVPYYLSLFDRSASVAQNIDSLFFAENSELRYEFKALYQALFKNADAYISIVSALSKSTKGLTRQMLLKKTKLQNNGAFSTMLEELESCGFIRSYLPFTGNSKKVAVTRLSKETLFQLVDFYTLFYYHFIEQNNFHDAHFWTNSYNSPVHTTWAGLSFEKLCMGHIEQIKQALGISGVQTNICSWIGEYDGEKAQIDLLIDRKDETINLCEMKFSDKTYPVSKSDYENIQNKVCVLRNATNTKKSIIVTAITPFGIKENQHSDIIQKQIVLDDLFVQ